MKVKMTGYVRVWITTEIDTNDEDEAYIEASGRLYDSVRLMVDSPDVTVDWSFDDYGLDMEVIPEERYIIASDIKWDTDGEDVPSLPSMVAINEVYLMHKTFERIEDLDGAEIADRVVEYLSDMYGFCVFGCKWNFENESQSCRNQAP